MAWQLQYTSAESGPTGRAGFQFTAETPGLPAGTHARAGLYLGYKPPPGATITPTPEQARAFPVALAYGPLDDGLRVLSRCVYLGQDYSGRYGNFLGHALIVTPAELAGLRPVEFWGAEIWADSPAPPGTALPEPGELVPGRLADPESLGEWLVAGGDAAYMRLGVLLDVVRHTLDRGHGRLILVAEHLDGIEDIVRWIAVISYSLPWPSADRLSFITYSGDPVNAAQIIVGTTPDVWIPAEIDATVVRLADPPDSASGAAGGQSTFTRFTRTIVSCWRSMDLAAIDAIAELCDTAGRAAGPEAAAALLALCRGDETVTPREQAAVASLLTGRRPDWVWRDLGGAVDRMGFELASAVAATAPDGLAKRCAARCVVLALGDRDLPPPARALPPGAREWLAPAVAEALAAARDLHGLSHVIRVARSAGIAVPYSEVERAVRALVGTGAAGLRAAIDATPREARDTLITAVVDGLESATPEVRESVLADDVVWALLSPGEWPHAPRTTASLLLTGVRRGRLSRVEATALLMSLPRRADHDDADDADYDADVPDRALRTLWRVPPSPDECTALVERLGPRIGSSSTLSDLPTRAYLAVGPDQQEAVRLARLVADEVPGYAAKDAEAVLIIVRTAGADTPVRAAAHLDRLTELTPEVDQTLHARIRTALATALARRSPMYRAALLESTSEHTAGWLTGEWLRRPRPNRDEQLALLEIAIRLRRTGKIISNLDAWARERANAWSLFGSVDSRFKHDAELSAGLDELKNPRPSTAFRWGRKPRDSARPDTGETAKGGEG
ncbi:hypothetical protein AB0K60_10630 [Thermopolyspora sp. NPDC052614]|uniref:GAP1-N2 domain-containing protein n=1 Tax=Thermopolyspora sp. NPDC052614 TaxID=3155682 RepID=UPI0034220933